MAHHTHHRRTIATSEPRTSVDKKYYPKHSSHPTTYLDHTQLSTSLNTDQRLRTSVKESRLDSHWQARAMSQSVIADSSKTLMSKPSSHFVKTVPDVQTHEKFRQAVKKEKLKPTQMEEKDLKKKSFSGQDIMKLIYVRAKEREKNKLYGRKELILEVEEAKEVKKVVQENDVRRPSVSLEKRLSFCGSQVELPDFLSGNGARVVSVDMSPFMQIHAVDCARKTYDSLEKFTSKALASTLKKEFDGAYGPAWHCIVGTSFGSFVTHSVGGFLYFSLDHKMYILLFKTTVQRAD